MTRYAETRHILPQGADEPRSSLRRNTEREIWGGSCPQMSEHMLPWLSTEALAGAGDP